jgi:signal transduction histidine kinase
VTAGVAGDQLRLEVRDNGVGLRAGQMSGHGIGTMNLRERLDAVYGGDGYLELFEDTAGGVVSRVSIPAHRQHDTSDGATALDADRPSAIARFFERWPVGGVLLAWAVWGALWSQQSVAYLAFRGRLGERSFLEIAAQDFMLVMIWAALTPLMLIASRLIPIGGRGLAARIVTHGIVGSAIAGIHLWATRQLLGGGSLSESVASISWGVLAYAVVLALVNQVRLRAWLRERALSDASMRADAAEAELDDTYSRTRPQQLLDSLETIARTVVTDAGSAERMLARLGDDLRASLDAKVPA